MPPNPALPSWSQVRAAILRNPLLNPSVQTPLTPPVDVTGKPEPPPVAPHEEGRLGYNPYRGTEMHGVPTPPHGADDAEGYGNGTIAVHYDEAPDEYEHAMPVRIVTQAPEMIKGWRVRQTLAPGVGNQTAQVVNRNRSRSSVTIKNLSPTDGVWIFPDASVSAFNGYFIAPNDKQDLTTTEEVWVISNTVNPVPIAIVIEFSETA